MTLTKEANVFGYLEENLMVGIKECAYLRTLI